jgi:hypothetical protein
MCPWRDAGASPSAPAPAGAGADSRPARIERGAHVSGRHNALPRVGNGLWMTHLDPGSSRVYALVSGREAGLGKCRGNFPAQFPTFSRHRQYPAS